MSGQDSARGRFDLGRWAIHSLILISVAPVSAQRTNRSDYVEKPSPLVASPVASSSEVAELTFDAAAYQAVKSADRVTLRAFQASPTSRFDLELERKEVLAHNAQIVLGTPEGDTPMPRPDVAIYRGRIAGDADSKVFMSFSPFGSNGFIRTGGRLFMLSSRYERQGVKTVAYDMAAFPLLLANPTPWQCGTDALAIPPDRLAWVNREDRVMSVASSQDITRRATLAIETDWEFTGTLFGGNTSASSAYATTLIGAVGEIYIEQIETDLEIGFLRIWSNSSDPWTSSNTSNQLSQFVSYWNANMGSVTRHAAHMLSGRNLGGGIAYLYGLCSDGFDYAVSANLDGSFPYPLQDHNSGNWDIMVTAHELGHNFGAPHTHSMSPPVDQCGSGNCAGASNGTIMSYCHTCPGGMSNIILDLHQRVIDEEILPFLNFGVECSLSTEPVDCGAIQSPATHALGGMNRYLAVVPGNPGQRTAIKITYDSVPPPNQHLTGKVV